MCGRFTLTAPGEALASAFDLDEMPDIQARYNIAPSQEVVAVELVPDGRKRLFRPRWGLVPKGAPADRPFINARAESAPTKPAFRGAFAERRCLVPADGFYEWQARPGERRKSAFHARLGQGRLFAIAGLWEPRPDGGRTLTLLTTEPNREMAEIHDRMPVILAPDAYGTWLDPRQSRRALVEVLRPLPDGALELRPVSDRVNDARAEGPECLLPPTGPSQLRLDVFQV